MPAPPVAVYRSLRAPALEIWPYLTRPDRLEQWLGRAEMEVAAGGELTAALWNGDAVHARITSLAPPSFLDLVWRSNGYDGATAVRVKLEHDGPGTRVWVRQEDLLTEIERRHAAAWWGEALAALRTAVHEGRCASAWGDGLPVVLRAPLGRTAEDIWPLLATARGIEKWLARVERYDAEPGAAFRFVSSYRGAEVVEQGHVEAVEPGRLVALAWEWVGQGWEARTSVELVLEPDMGGVALLLRHSGFEALAGETRLAARRNYAAAWRDVLTDLRRLVAPGPAVS